MLMLAVTIMLMLISGPFSLDVLFIFVIKTKKTEITNISYFLAVDLCSKFPCRFGGRCKSTSFNFTCACPVGCLGLTCVEGKHYILDECVQLKLLIRCFKTKKSRRFGTSVPSSVNSRSV